MRVNYVKISINVYNFLGSPSIALSNLSKIKKFFIPLQFKSKNKMRKIGMGQWNGRLT